MVVLEQPTMYKRQCWSPNVFLDWLVYQISKPIILFFSSKLLAYNILLFLKTFLMLKIVGRHVDYRTWMMCERQNSSIIELRSIMECFVLIKTQETLKVFWRHRVSNQLLLNMKLWHDMAGWIRYSMVGVNICTSSIEWLDELVYQTTVGPWW